MTKPILSLLVGAATLILFLASGCAHPCGYVDVHTRLTPIGNEREVKQLPADQPLRIVRDITPTNSVIELLVEQREVSTGLAGQETYGRRTYVPFRWHAPIVKPLAAVTVVLPLYFSASDPHCHGGGNWGLLDYLRDVCSWFNPFSGIPTGHRKVDNETRRMRYCDVLAPLAERRVPVSGSTVELYLDDVKVAEGVSDAEGRVRFDLAEQITPEFAQAGHRLRVVSRIADGRAANLDWNVSAGELGGLPGKRASGQENPNE